METKPEVKTSQHAIRYLIIGSIVTISNYCFYAFISNLIIKNNDLIWLSSFISTTISTIIAYIMHSKITWKERPITKHSLYRFFIWNIVVSIICSPFLTQLFSLITPLYNFAFQISNSLNLSFSYDFILTTGAFILTTVIIAILNYLFYDKFVFGKPTTKTSQKTNP